jgi:cytochrome c
MNGFKCHSEELNLVMHKRTLTVAIPVLLLSAVAATAGAPAKGDAAKGKEVFEQCGVCHSLTGEKKMGPSLKGLFTKAKMVNGQKPTDANVLALINKGKGAMPAFGETLTDQEKADVIAFLHTQ